MKFRSVFVHHLQLPMAPKSPTWTDQLEKIINDVADSCKIQEELYLKASQKYDHYHRWIGWPIVALQGAAAAGSIFTSLQCDPGTATGTGIFLALIMALQTFHMTAKFEGKSRDFLNASAMYGELHGHIRLALAYDKHTRDKLYKPGKFIDDIIGKYSKLRRTAPIIPRRLYTDNYVEQKISSEAKHTIVAISPTMEDSPTPRDDIEAPAPKKRPRLMLQDDLLVELNRLRKKEIGENALDTTFMKTSHKDPSY